MTNFKISGIRTGHFYVIKIIKKGCKGSNLSFLKYMFTTVKHLSCKRKKFDVFNSYSSLLTDKLNELIFYKVYVILHVLKSIIMHNVIQFSLNKKYMLLFRGVQS